MKRICRLKHPERGRIFYPLLKKVKLYASFQRNQNQEISSETFQDHR
jgi:hypothetical protein